MSARRAYGTGSVYQLSEWLSNEGENMSDLVEFLRRARCGLTEHRWENTATFLGRMQAQDPGNRHEMRVVTESYCERCGSLRTLTVKAFR